MSLNHGSLTTHIPQSLPSFAQAFSSPSLNSISSGNNSLPPIQSRPPSLEKRRVSSPSRSKSRPPSAEAPGARFNSRKRQRNDVIPATRDDDTSGSDRQSPRIVRVKEEPDHDMLDPPSPPSQSQLIDTGAPAPSSVHPPSKKRRTTIGGLGPNPLNTDLASVPADHSNLTPISPVVMGLPITRDDSAAIEQIRSMLTVKQKQKVLIEQRRGSVVGIAPPIGGNAVNQATSATEERTVAPKPPATVPRPARRSPNSGSGRQGANVSNPAKVVNTGHTRPPSPSPLIVPSQQPQVPSQSTMGHSLPPPPISFARRRAGQFGAGKKKPADIIISPREAYTKEQFQPEIQSAPPVPHAGQSQFYAGRFPMTLPRLPPIIGTGDNARKVTAQVPPTPTRLTLPRNPQPVTHLTAPPIPGISGRSPPAASVPIATTLVPPTPASLHHPGYSGDKSAFLQPFEIFFDALNDSKQLKSWLGEQLQRSNALMQSLAQQQEKLHETVNNLVDRKVSGMRDEVIGLHRRVEELEDALRVATGEASGRRHSIDTMVGARLRSQQQHSRSAVPVPGSPMAAETYTFPPVAQIESLRSRAEGSRRVLSPEWRQQEREREREREHESQGVSEPNPSPPSTYNNNRRLSISAIRLDPPRPQPAESSSPSFQRRGSHVMLSPPQGHREIVPSHGLPPPPPPTHSVKSPVLGGSATTPSVPSWNNHAQTQRSYRYQQPESAGEGKPNDKPSPPTIGSRRGSVVVPPPDQRPADMDDT